MDSETAEIVYNCKALKKKHNLTNQQIADGSKIPIGTVNRFFSNTSSGFRTETINQIRDYLNSIDSERFEHVRSEDLRRELTFAEKLIEQKDWTIEAMWNTIQSLRTLLFCMFCLCLLLVLPLFRYIFLDSLNNNVGFILDGHITPVGLICIILCVLLIVVIVAVFVKFIRKER